MNSSFANLLEPTRLGSTQVRNRLFNPPHGTTLGHNGQVTDELIAYHQTRAQGGAGLIILEGMTLHPTYGFPESFLYAGSDNIIPGMARLAEACREYDTPVFGQLFHAGRAVRLSHDGSRPVTYSASDIPDERYRVIPVPMPNDMVWEIIESYANAANRLAEAGLDGVEILASMGYLIAQFLNPATNTREDDFGGSEEGRMKLLREIVSAVRQRIGPDKTLGVRVTLDEKVDSALDADTMIRACQALERDGDVDYFSVISGSTAAPAGWIHVFPPMAVPHAFVADDAARLKAAIDKPVLVAGRVNQPQVAESILAEGKADMVGMARALIADPEFMNKVAAGRAEDIRACVGCNQACVGHRLAHHPVSCIQHPESGRESSVVSNSTTHQHILIIGAGPAGMKTAVEAASLGHRVTLLEKTSTPGGQVNLAEKLPGRAEFGGVTTNLLHELETLGVEIQLNTEADQEMVADLQPDNVIFAAGAVPRLPEIETEDVALVDAWSAIRGDGDVGQRVAIADWACDWSGLGLAQKLALDGHHVRLYCGASVPGESLQGIVRDHWIGEVHRLGIEVITFARLYGASGDTVFFQHMINDEPILCEDVDTVVSCYAPRAAEVPQWLSEQCPDIRVVGDALTPRTVEEAILEGFQALHVTPGARAA